MTREAYKVRRKRVNLDFHPEVKEKIESIRDAICADSMAEVLRRSVLLYEQVFLAQQRGEAVILRQADGTERQVLVA